ncbi:MAG: bifunctional riboflavin kinase/FAD synthetase [Planctomycetaceae bacterium]
MIVQQGIAAFTAGRGGCLTIGNFDGVHRGHQRILGTLVAQARECGVPAVAMTFDPHPIVLLAPHRAPPNLSTLSRKTELIERCGVDVLVVVETSRELLQLAPEEFFERIVRGDLAAGGMVEGPNFYFGRDRAGDVGLLQTLCIQAGMTFEVVDPVEHNGQIVSSSVIRRAISAGQVRDAVDQLGHPYQLAGTVVSGMQRGRQIGFPTANLAEMSTLLPADGVYAGSTRLDNRTFAAAVHIGPNPTFGDDDRKIEVHLLGFTGDLYGQLLSVDLLSEIRPTRTFDSRDQLIRQVQQDLQSVALLVAGECQGEP